MSNSEKITIRQVVVQVDKVERQNRGETRLKKQANEVERVPFPVVRLAEEIHSWLIPHKTEYRWIRHSSAASVSRLRIRLRGNSTQFKSRIWRQEF